MQVVKLTKAKYRDLESQKAVLCTHGVCLAILPKTETSCKKCGCPTVININHAALAGYVEIEEKSLRTVGE